MTLRIADRFVGPDHPPLIVAEMSGNHNQSLERALAIVDAAAAAGAHALKLQTYTADTMTLDLDCGEFHVSDEKSIWHGQSLHALYQQAHTPWDWHRTLFERAREKGLIAFSTPFDETAVDFLETLEVPCYKIASFEIVDLPLIARVASTGKPMLMSTGMASMAEIDEAVRTARQAGCPDIVLLKCTSTYPATPVDTNLLTLPNLRDWSGCQIGLSDHTMGIGAAVAAVALGATLIEKHFTLDRAEGGVDASFSMEPAEMALLVTETTRAWQALGRIHYGPTRAEETSTQYRRSLYAAADIAAGEAFTRANVRAIRPGLGLPPKYLARLVGKTSRRSIPRGTPLGWEDI